MVSLDIQTMPQLFKGWISPVKIYLVIQQVVPSSL